MRQSAAWGLYVVSGTTAHQAAVALSLLLGGGLVFQGAVTPEQLTGFVFYVQLVTSSSLAVCDQWGAIMEVRSKDFLLQLGNMSKTPAHPAHMRMHACASGCGRLRVLRANGAPPAGGLSRASASAERAAPLPHGALTRSPCPCRVPHRRLHP